MTPESAVQQLAATLLAREVTPELLATLQEPATAGILIQLAPDCADLLQNTWTDQDFEDAAVEFCRLFILNPAVPARAAAYFEDEKSNEIAGRIQFMLDNGFLELPESFQTLAPDHISLLLIVQGTLAGEDATQFQADNLPPWVSTFSKSLSETTEHPLYRLAAKLVKLSS
jgi:TorA maturation chaperone TorD